MSLYIRKSIKVGPFRFNLSKSGVGVSAGVTGFRVGTGPRGNYVHMGRGGIYYRTTISPESQQQRSRPERDDSVGAVPFSPEIPADSHEPLQEIESGDVVNMVDSSSRGLVEEINEKSREIRLFPFACLLGIGVTIYIALGDVPDWAILLCGALSLACAIASSYRDSVVKSTVVLYDIEDEFQGVYESLHNAFSQMANCKGRWHMEAEGRVKDSKYHAGADSLVRRKPINLLVENPPYIKTNVAAPSVPVGNQTLYFFPDMVLVLDKNGAGAVSYENLSIQVTSQKFIEEGPVPVDARIVDHTWKYVNKRGGPDKRFKDNRQLPVALYEDVYFISDTGLNERIELSKTGVSDSFAHAIRNVGNTNRSYI